MTYKKEWLKVFKSIDPITVSCTNGVKYMEKEKSNGRKYCLLNEVLTETIYMKQPQGFELEGKKE